MNHWSLVLPTVALLCATGCYNGVDIDAASGTEGQEQGEEDGNEAGDSEGEAVELPSPVPRAYRLTHTQWENTVQDLFELPEPTGHSNLFRADPKVAGYIFDNGATSLEVDEALWTGYRLAAGAVAEQVTDNPEALAALMPAEGPSEAERIDTFVGEFGTRAYRRPLSEDELTILTSLFNGAPGFYPDEDDAFVAGIRHVVEAVLQSPYFLYRVERSEEVVAELIPLDDYELASRLSYFLWNTMPDAALFEAAAAGEVHTPEQVASETARMLEDPRAASMVVDFHRQLLDADKFDTISPSPNSFPDAPASLPELAAREHELFIRDVVFGNEGGLAELLTSTQTFANAELAALYGIEGVVGEDFVELSLDANERRGVFTQVGFLASNATSVDPDPIHRGVFMVTRMLCLPIAAPPDGVPPLPATEPGQTNRERVAAHTEASAPCDQCHSTLINPHGFVFEGYDAIGAWRTTDNGKPVDSSATVFVDTPPATVSGAIEMVELMAQSPGVHDCYARHWLEYTLGQNSDTSDSAVIGRLGDGSLVEQQSLQDLLVAMTASPFFLNRAAQELP